MPTNALTAPDPIHLTLFEKAATGTENPILTKVISPNESGSITKDSSQCVMPRGFAMPKQVRSLDELAGGISTVIHSQAIGLGRVVASQAQLQQASGLQFYNVVTKEDLTRYPGCIARERGAFAWPTGRALILFDHDHDPRSHVNCTSPDELVHKIRTLDESLAKAAVLVTASSSAGLIDARTGQPIVGSGGGMHAYVVIEGVTSDEEVLRYRDYLFAKAIISGQGYIKISRDGKMLERTFFDRHVWDPSRLIFEGPPVLQGGLAQNHLQPLLYPGEDVTLTTRGKYAVDRAYGKALTALRNAAHADARRVRGRYREQRIGQLMADEKIDRGRAEVMVREMLNGTAVLAAEMKLQRANGQHLYIRDLLEYVERDVAAAQQEFAGTYVTDPLEPEEGPHRAKINIEVINGAPVVTLYSFLHGGRTFHVPSDEERAAKRPTVYLGGAKDQRTVVENLAALGHAIAECRNHLDDNRLELYRSGDANLIDAAVVQREFARDTDPTTGVIAQDASREFSVLMSRHIDFEEVVEDKDGNAFTRLASRCPIDLAADYLSQNRHWEVPPLDYIARWPTVDPWTGRAITQDTYETTAGGRGVLYRMGALTLPPIPAVIDDATCRRALEIIDRPYAEFPFTTEVARQSGPLSMLATQWWRPYLNVVPAIAVDAPSPATGKSLLQDVGNIIVLGRTIPATNVKGREEFEKHLSAHLIRRDPVVRIDNIDAAAGTREDPLRSPLLCSVVTEPEVSVRPFGRNDITETISNSAVIQLNGNHLTIRGDFTRRTMLLELDAGVERPAERKFTGIPGGASGLRMWAAGNRAEVLWALMVLARRFAMSVDIDELMAGGGLLADRNSIGGFDAWSATVRAMCLFYSRPDPVELIQRAMARDPEAERNRALLEGVSHLMGAEPFTIGRLSHELQQQANSMMMFADPNVRPDPINESQLSLRREALEALQEILQERAVGMEKNPRWFDSVVLSATLTSIKDRPLGDLKIVNSGKTSRFGREWRVLDLSGQCGGAPAGLILPQRPNGQGGPITFQPPRDAAVLPTWRAT